MFGFEIKLLEALEKMRCTFMNNLFEIVTLPGEETVVVVLLAIIYFMYDKNLAKRIFYITVTSLGINSIIKNIVKLPRPFADGKITCVRPETATGYSFPSGHTQNTATWTSAFAIKYKKPWLITACCILTCAVGFSRLYLGAHYPSDVITGIVLGVSLAVIGNKLFDRVRNENILYTATTLSMIPFAIFFLLNPDPLFEDFYKIFGLMSGLAAASPFEEKYIKFNYNTSMFKKILRVIMSVTIAFIVKEITKSLIPSDSLHIIFIAEAIRYFLLVFTVFGLLPLLFKKMKI